MATRGAEVKPYSTPIPPSDRLEIAYDQISPHLTSEITIAELQGYGVPPNQVVTVMHLIPDRQLADRLWVEAQAVFGEFWRKERPARERAYEPVVAGLFGLRNEFAEVVATNAPLGSRTLIIDIGAATGHQIEPTVRAIRAKNPDIELGVIGVDIDDEVERPFREQLGWVGLTYGDFVSADFSDGLFPPIQERIESFNPDAVVYLGFYAPTYMPLDRQERLVESSFDLVKDPGIRTSLHILMLNRQFDPRILGERAQSEIIPQLMESEEGQKIVGAAMPVMEEAIGHGQRVIQTLPIYDEEDLRYLGNFTADTQEVLYGHSLVISVQPKAP